METCFILREMRGNLFVLAVCCRRRRRRRRRRHRRRRRGCCCCCCCCCCCFSFITMRSQVPRRPSHPVRGKTERLINQYLQKRAVAVSSPHKQTLAVELLPQVARSHGAVDYFPRARKVTQAPRRAQAAFGRMSGDSCLSLLHFRVC